MFRRPLMASPNRPSLTNPITVEIGLITDAWNRSEVRSQVKVGTIKESITRELRKYQFLMRVSCK